MTAEEFINLIVPDHDRISCSDRTLSNGFFSRDTEGHGRCTRCMWLGLARGEQLPEGLDPAGNIFDVLG